MRRFGNRALARLSQEDLLDTRICDLGVRIERTPLQERIDKVMGELAARGIEFQPHFWLSEEWFTPDGVPGVAIPFYLADSRLMRLEQRQMLEAEGGSEESCLRILRHEVGHAIDNAYRLRRRRTWREVFGKASIEYPESYSPRPYSRRFVVNIEPWYAQAHPVEDFAETFAVWLKPHSAWRQQYADWPALRKLEYVDHLMKEISGRKPLVVNRRRVDPLRTIRTTLREHYERKRAYYDRDLDVSTIYDHELRLLFTDAPESRGNRSAAALLGAMRPRIRAAVSRWTGLYQYTIDQVLSAIIERCRELKLRVGRPEDEVERGMVIVLTMHVMNYIHRGEHRITL